MLKTSVASVLAMLVAQANPGPFLDTVGHPHEQQIQTVYERGIVEGYGYGIFRPDIPINRAEFLKILMLSAHGTDSVVQRELRCFRDFVGEPQWFWTHACRAKELGIIGGYPDGTFRGTQTVNLAEALKITVGALGFQTPVYLGPPENWYLPYFAVASEQGLFEYFPRDGTHLLTRSEMAYMIVEIGEPPPVVIAASSSAASSAAPPPPPLPVCGNGVTEAGEECDDGNLENGDGCSSICVVVEEPIRHAALKITQRPIRVSGVTAGTEGVVLFAFEAVAGRQDADISRLSFQSQVGRLSYAQDYTIYYDSDGDGSADRSAARASPEGEVVTFSALAIPTPDGEAVRVELRADVRQNISSNALGVSFALNDPLFVQGVGKEDGRDLTGIELDGGDCVDQSICWIAVVTQSVQAIDLFGKGNLFITADSTPVPSHQVLGGEISDDLLRINMRAEGEDIEITDLTFKGIPESFEQVLMFAEGSEEPVAEARVTNCKLFVSSQLCADTEIVLPADEEQTYILRGKMKLDAEGGQSGDTAQLQILGSGNSSMVIEARGKQSQQTLNDSDGDAVAEGEIFIGRNNPGPNNNIVGQEHDLLLAKIESIENANPMPDGTAIAVGTAPFGVFRFSAAEHDNTFDGSNNVTIRSLVFTVNASNVQFFADSFSVYNVEDAAVTASCTASDTTGTITVTCDALHDSEVSTVIEAGESIELALQGLVLKAQILPGGSTLQAALQSLSSRTSGGTVVWDDGITTVDWVDIGQTVVNSTRYEN